MRAIVQAKYGPLESLESDEIGVPEVGEREVLVRIRAAALHIGDVFAVTGSPLPMRLVTGLMRPRYGVPGYDLSGHVEAVGPAVLSLRRGDEVFGCAQGTCAEYARVAETKLASKPANLSHEQAAALPTSGLAALHGLRDTGGLRAGQKVLIVGASGGVGSFAVQIAKAMGAEVTGVTSTRNLELVLSLGADHVIDYTREDFAEGGPRYDLILDNVENRSLDDCRRALKPEGTLVLNSGTGSKGLEGIVRQVRPLVLTPFVHQRLRRYLSRPNSADLHVLRTLAEDGRLKPVVDRAYPLAETPAALRYIAAGHARGKVVITVGEASEDAERLTAA
jgi:NADPH:quinone reductase-like Zn-dependent oxidoreductase